MAEHALAEPRSRIAIQPTPAVVCEISRVRYSPNIREAIVFACVCSVLYVSAIVALGSYWGTVHGFGDNQPYIQIAHAIQRWDFSQLHAKLFWGLPYFMAAGSILTRVPLTVSLLLISFLCSIIAVLLICKLWDTWTAIFFVIFSREWLERSLLGGAEPLFMTFVFGAFLAVRREKWWLASLLASLATVVRPMGIFVLIAIGLVLVWRRDYRRLSVASAIGVFVGLMYVLPFTIYFGTPIANVKGYDHADWNSGVPLNFPGVAIVQDVIAAHGTKLNLVRTVLWIML